MSIPKTDIIAAIEQAKEAFSSAVLGKDVRQGMVDVADALITAVDEWAVLVDDTLTNEGEAADAKAVGDTLKETPYNKGVLAGGNLDNVLDNGIRRLNTDSYTYTNLPTDASGLMFLVSMQSGDAYLHMLCNSYGSIWTRRKVNTWTPWRGGIDGTLSTQYAAADAKAVGDKLAKALLNSTVTITGSNKTDYFSDANDAPLNSVYRVKSSAEMENTPYGDGYSHGGSTSYNGTIRSITGYLDGVLFTFGVDDNHGNQIFICGNGESTPNAPIMFFRSSYTTGGVKTWTEWSIQSDRAAITGTNRVIRKKLIAPYLDAQGNPTATETITPNPQYIDDPLYFKDFNDAPLNSVYQIDLDCDASVMANNPLSGKSNILMTWCWSHYRRHAVVQFCIGLTPGSGTQAEFYYRYGYDNPPFVWTNWESARATTDSTLGIAGRAADAKTVGDRLAALEARIAALEA